MTLFPADDDRFRDATILAVELFTPGPHGHRTSPRLVDDERSLAAAQALLRAAYPLAVILVEPGPSVDITARRSTPWMIFRDPGVLDHRLLLAARGGQPEAAAQLADRYQAAAFLFAWVASGETAAAAAGVTEAMAQLLGSEEPVDGEHVGDGFLRLARRSAMARQTPATTGDDEERGRARVHVSAMLARLPAAQATAVSLAYGEGLSESEVALAVGLDRDRTRASIRDGLAMLVDAPRLEYPVEHGPT